MNSSCFPDVRWNEILRVKTQNPNNIQSVPVGLLAVWVRVRPVPPGTECVSTLPAGPLHFPSIPGSQEPEELLHLNLKQTVVLLHHTDAFKGGVALD